jgi:hypothetical protein
MFKPPTRKTLTVVPVDFPKTAPAAGRCTANRAGTFTLSERNADATLAPPAGQAIPRLSKPYPVQATLTPTATGRSRRATSR